MLSFELKLKFSWKNIWNSLNTHVYFWDKNKVNKIHADMPQKKRIYMKTNLLETSQNIIHVVKILDSLKLVHHYITQ